MYLIRGIVAYATTKTPVYGASNITSYNTLGVNLTFTIAILLIAFAIFQYTGLGNRLKAIGAGETAARFAGVRVEKTKMLVYAAAGMPFLFLSITKEERHKLS